MAFGLPYGNPHGFSCCKSKTSFLSPEKGEREDIGLRQLCQPLMNQANQEQTWPSFSGPDIVSSRLLCPHSSTLAWKIPWMEEPGGLQSMGLWLSDFTFTFHFLVLEKEMATHSSDLAWRIPGTAEPGGLPSMGSHRVRHDWSDLAAAAAADSFVIFWLRRD